MQLEGSLFSQLVSNEDISWDIFCRGHLSHSMRVCGDGSPCVINKEHGTFQKFYMGEEGNQKHLEELCYYCWVLQANASGELGVGVEGGLEELRTPPSQLQIRHKHSDLAKVKQLAHNSTPRWPGVVKLSIIRVWGGWGRRTENWRSCTAQREQDHIARPCIKKLRARVERQPCQHNACHSSIRTWAQLPGHKKD